MLIMLGSSLSLQVLNDNWVTWAHFEAIRLDTLAQEE